MSDGPDLMNPKSSTISKMSICPEGFTLLEILIAMFIFAVVLSTIYTAYTGTFRNIEETESEAEVYEMARVALDRMVEDIGSAYMSKKIEDSEADEEIFHPTRFVGQADEIDDRRADTLRFVSKAHLTFTENETDAGTAEIVYYTREHSEESGSLVLYRSDTPNFELREGEGMTGWILCNGLHSVHFTYYDKKGDAYDSWDSTGELFRDKLPSAITITLEFVDKKDPESPLKFMTSVAIPTAGSVYEKAS
jgi:general secretion pathway protein J